MASLVLAVSCAAAPARGEGRAGRLSFEPSLRLAVVADDNPALRASARSGDLGVWLEPRVELRYDRESARAGADLAAQLRAYHSHSELDDILLDLRGFGEIGPVRGLSLRVEDALLPQPVRLGRPSDEFANLRQANRLRAELRYRRELAGGRSLELGAAASRLSTRSFRAPLEPAVAGAAPRSGLIRGDALDSTGFGELRLPLGRRSHVFVRAEVLRRHYRDLPDASFLDVGGVTGLRERLGRRLELSVAAGYGSVHFDGLPTDAQLIGSARLRYELPRGTTLVLEALRRSTTDSLGGDFGETALRAELTKRLAVHTSARLGFLLRDLRGAAARETSERVLAVRFGLRRQLRRHLRAELTYRYWHDAGAAGARGSLEQNRVILELTYRR